MDATKQTILERLNNLHVWRRGGERAPHKALLILLSLAHLARGNDRLIDFNEIERPLANLLRNYGPARKSVHPEYPFWHLQRDLLWEVSGVDRLMRRTGGTLPLKSELIKHRVSGGFPEEIYGLLRKDRRLLEEVVL